jgi:hypothetical protein
LKIFASLFLGALTGTAAVFLHLLLPPFGLILSILGSFTAIWIVGRKLGKRRYKFFACISWIFVFAKAASYGNGGELLVQGDNLGSALMFLGVAAIITATALPA